MQTPLNITFSVSEKYRDMKPSLIKRIDTLAKTKQRSRSWIIIQALLRYLDEEEKAYDK